MKRPELFSSSKDLGTVIALVHTEMLHAQDCFLRAQSTCVKRPLLLASLGLFQVTRLAFRGFCSGFDCASRHLKADQHHRDETPRPRLLRTSYRD